MEERKVSFPSGNEAIVPSTYRPFTVVNIYIFDRRLNEMVYSCPENLSEPDAQKNRVICVSGTGVRAAVFVSNG